MTLSAQEIQQIHDFVKVNLTQGDYYDIQVELVDHFASAIEEKREENPDLKIDTAIQEVWQTFAPYNFNQIFDEKYKAIIKDTTRQWFRGLLSWFKFPKIFLSVLLFFLAWAYCSVVPTVWAFPGFGLIVLVVSLYYLRKWDYSFKRFGKIARLSLTAIHGVFYGLIIVNIGPLIADFLFPTGTSEQVNDASISYMGISAALIITIQAIVLLNHIQVRGADVDKAKRDYPEIFTKTA